tara:strand:+ start:269 stop:394 length:126 start_codon:yes stop_codon:yes gene_type:complete
VKKVRLGKNYALLMRSRYAEKKENSKKYSKKDRRKNKKLDF